MLRHSQKDSRNVKRNTTIFLKVAEPIRRQHSLAQHSSRWLCFGLLASMLGSGGVGASEPIAFTNLANDPTSGIIFERGRSESYEGLLETFVQSQRTPLSFEEIISTTPHRPGGFSGVALIDHDKDGDLDIYVTNGPSAANGLFNNELRESGQLSFTDISHTSGAAAEDLDSNGVCFGDLDNDGDEDLFVLGREQGNRLYENIDGKFSEVYHHGAEGGTDSHISCSMGDIDHDGLLDIAVSNAFVLDNALALAAIPYALNQRNYLFKNTDGMHFSDVSGSSGIRNMILGETSDPQPPTISWAVAMVDIDSDGDTDIVFGDDQAGLPNEGNGGFDRGYLQIFLNNGSGVFTNSPIQLNDHSSSAWMGLGFGDLDCNGTLDIFASNLGDYMLPATGVPTTLGAEESRALFGNGDGTFTDRPTGEATAFGWGNAVADLDNDGDPDILYHGAMDLNAIITHDNPGVVLENQGCSGKFRKNLVAFRGDYTLRGTQGVAVGDLDRDGYIDVVTSANHRIDPAIPFFVSPAQYGSPLDASANFYLPMLADPVSGLLSWGGIETLSGNMSVEINQGHGTGAVTVQALGTVGLTREGSVNRSGIGTVMHFTPHGGQTTSSPIVGGSSFASQHAIEAHFGLGSSKFGTLDVSWPGGVRNRLYRVRAGEDLTIPEIPCSIDSDRSFSQHSRCVRDALKDMSESGAISKKFSRRLYVSAIVGFLSSHR